MLKPKFNGNLEKNEANEVKEDSPITNAQLVIENKIIDAVYSFSQDIFRSKTRFEMILSQPNPKFKFEKIRGIFKGRFICKNPDCLQLKQEFSSRAQGRQKHKIQTIKEQTSEELDQNWTNCEERQEKIAAKSEKKLEKKSLKNQSNKCIEEHEKEGNSVQNEKFDKQQTENTTWSSSLSYVIFNYCSHPAPLDKLLSIYQDKKDKIEIYFYVQLLGQKCKGCEKTPYYCYPWFGRIELKRITKNFSSYIYNKIYHRQIKRYKPCTLRRLVNHISELCEACKRDECREKGIKCL